MPRITQPSDIPQSSASPPPNGKTILIAEDDPFISRMYEIKLKAAGYDVIVKNNGRDAYLQIKADWPDLIMLDITMPEMTGFEVLGALRADGYDPATAPVIILTNSSSTENQQLAKSFGADYMIKAELTPRNVLDKINATLFPDKASG
ncbi:MAG TPA: response regulator [Candidatus Saccharimonadales bacterium]|nr:response regulator [Candidatus Saccharimonadales bacterium]